MMAEAGPPPQVVLLRRSRGDGPDYDGGERGAAADGGALGELLRENCELTAQVGPCPPMQSQVKGFENLTDQNEATPICSLDNNISMCKQTRSFSPIQLSGLLFQA